ncbi:hypothetical protein NDN08_007626 [Rhodosorus marinus]|uniref:SREBP regulating gene protein n=1 Tax=Rhodosorus marinus TaxID=101924 RepID=A0AAV8UY36_9RHOD|nr:hypothetical protein NDN08_007626 [Rhodosorus marinus]
MGDAEERFYSQLEEEGESFFFEYVLPQQRKSYLCSAQCCDSPKDPMTSRLCVAQCRRLVDTLRKFYVEELRSLAGRYEKCAERCESVGDEAKANPMTYPRTNFGKCSEFCALEFLNLVPKTIESLRTTARTRLADASQSN